jgi:hypothetical protein
MTRLRLAAIALLLLTSTNAWADLKTYEVDPQYQHEIYSALQVVLEPQAGLPQGRVQMLPSGQILVNASAETLEQIEQVLQAIRTRAVAAAPRVELRYWTVFGSRAAVANPPGTAAPSSLRDVLAELERLHGDLQFRVLGTAALTTLSGQHGELGGGTTLRVEQTAFVQGETLNATIEMHQGQLYGLNVGNVQVRTALRRGEFVVLGEGQLVGRRLDGNGGGNGLDGDMLDGPVFYIVHWPEE